MALHPYPVGEQVNTSVHNLAALPQEDPLRFLYPDAFLPDTRPD